MDNIYVDGDITFTGDLLGDGSALSGIVTQIVPGSGINISPVEGTGKLFKLVLVVLTLLVTLVLVLDLQILEFQVIHLLVLV